MDDKQIIQRYLNDIRRHLVPKLRPGVGISSNFYPASTGGGLLEIKFGPQQANVDQVLATSSTIGHILQIVPQRTFPGDFTGMKFSGTNVVLEGDRLLLIKGGDDPADWTDAAAAKDLEFAFHRGNK
jgi:hypothetical protein